MNKKFTKLIAALALLVFMTPSLVGWGQTRDNYSGTFTRITSASDFVTGYYVITGSQSASANNKALGSSVDNNKRIAGVQVMINNNNQIIDPVNTVVYYITVTTSGETKTCTFQNVSTSKYMYQASTTSGKGMGFSDDAKNITLAGYNSTSPIGFKFTLNGNSNNFFKWNNSSSWYANYANDYTTSMAPVELFKLESSTSTVATPTFDPADGATFINGDVVLVECATQDADIYYTMGDNPADPTNASTLYDPDEGIEVTQSTTIKAIAYLNGEYSSVATASYTVLTPLTTMDEIFAAATAANATPAQVAITFNNWIVTGVGSNGKRAFVTDGTKGFIIYNSTQNSLTFERGQVLSGAKVCQVQLLNGAPCVIGLNANDFNITQTGQQPTVTTTTISALGAVNTGAVVNLGILTWNGSCFVDDNDNRINYYNTIYGGNSFTTDKRYSVKGVYVHYTAGENGIPKEIAPRDADDIVEYVEPSITIPAEDLQLSFRELEDGSFTVNYTNFDPYLAEATLYYNEECTQPFPTSGTDAWIMIENMEDPYTSIGYMLDANTAAATRTVYLKVYAVEEDEDEIEAVFTITQAAQPSQHTLSVTSLTNVEMVVFVGPESEMKFEGIGSSQVFEDDNVMLSVVPEEGYIIQSLMVDDIEHVADIDEGYTYIFDMPDHDVTITATAVERPLGATFIFDTDAGLQALGITKPSSGNGTNLAENQNYTLDGVTMTCTHGSTKTRVWNSNGFTDLRVYNGGSLTFTAPANNYVITSITFTGSDKFDDWSGAENSHTFNATSTMKIKTITVAYALVITKEIVLNQWNLIASPIEVNPANVEGMVAESTDPNYSNFDLYYFDETGGTNGKEWKNYKANAFNLVPGKGYLYANTANDDLVFIGTMATSLAEVDLPYDGESAIKSLYLAGNSLQQETTFYVYDGEFAKQTVNFLTLNGTGDGFVTSETNAFTAQALQGFFVQSGGTGWMLSTADMEDGKSGTPELLNIMVNQNRGTLVDNAIVSFSDAPMMSKFYLNDNSTRVYIPQNGEDMAVVRSEAQGEMPVNFRAAENGTYTLSIDIENVDMNYLHLIDNMTGMDIDLLQTPSYTFEATTRDYESRFRLVFAGASTGSATDEPFAFFSNGNLIINNDGNATLQVIDITGRILSSENVNGSVSTTLNATPGVYMLRLINGENVKVQKIVVR